MSEPEIVYRFSPPFEGAFVANVPQRDLTQADVDRLTPMQVRDALMPHPVTGTPLFTAVGGKEKREQERVVAAATRAIDAAEKAAEKDGDA